MGGGGEGDRFIRDLLTPKKMDTSEKMSTLSRKANCCGGLTLAWEGFSRHLIVDKPFLLILFLPYLINSSCMGIFKAKFWYHVKAMTMKNILQTSWGCYLLYSFFFFDESSVGIGCLFEEACATYLFGKPPHLIVSIRLSLLSHYFWCCPYILPNCLISRKCRAGWWWVRKKEKEGWSTSFCFLWDFVGCFRFDRMFCLSWMTMSQVCPCTLGNELHPIQSKPVVPLFIIYKSAFAAVLLEFSGWQHQSLSMIAMGMQRRSFLIKPFGEHWSFQKKKSSSVMVMRVQHQSLSVIAVSIQHRSLLLLVGVYDILHGTLSSCASSQWRWMSITVVFSAGHVNILKTSGQSMAVSQCCDQIFISTKHVWLNSV